MSGFAERNVQGLSGNDNKLIKEFYETDVVTTNNYYV